MSFLWIRDYYISLKAMTDFWARAKKIVTPSDILE